MNLHYLLKIKKDEEKPPPTKVLLQAGWTLKHQLCATISFGIG